MKFTDKISTFLANLGATAKSLIKVALQSRRNTVSKAQAAIDGKPIIIMGNGPSLSPMIESYAEQLALSSTMAVNFAANADEFTIIRPDFYLLADPHFFENRETDPNVARLFQRFNEVVTWPMTLYVPCGHKADNMAITNLNIKVENFNFVGIEGFHWIEHALFNAGFGMPRPRNVLIPAIMTAVRAGFKEIYIIGADHGWLSTLSVTNDNELISIQPHFYKDNTSEQQRVASVYKNVRLHEILLSMHLAFKSYHVVENYAKTCHIEIFNSTPNSFIDAFRRSPLPWEK